MLAFLAPKAEDLSAFPQSLMVVTCQQFPGEVLIVPCDLKNHRTEGQDFCGENAEGSLQSQGCNLWLSK